MTITLTREERAELAAWLCYATSEIWCCVCGHEDKGVPTAALEREAARVDALIDRLGDATAAVTIADLDAAVRALGRTPGIAFGDALPRAEAAYFRFTERRRQERRKAKEAA